jgi:hypothetical protein
MAVLFANDAFSTLAGSITNVATAANLAAGTGALFPSPTGSDYFVMTLGDPSTGPYEIAHVTSRTGDAVTLVRAQEGTTAAAWSAGANASNLLTAGQMTTIQNQNSANQQQTSNYAVDTGSADALSIMLSPDPLALANLVGAPVRIKKAASDNTGAATLVVNGLPATPIVHADGTNPGAAELPTGGVFEVVYVASLGFVLQSMTHGPALAADMETGTNDVKQVTAKYLPYHNSAIKAWANFHWSGAAVVVTASFNVASIARIGVGHYQATLSGGLNYTHGYAAPTGNGPNPATAGSIGMGKGFSGVDPVVDIYFGDAGGSGGQASDPSDAGVTFFGLTAN